MHRRLHRGLAIFFVAAAITVANVVEFSGTAVAAGFAGSGCGGTVAKPGGGVWVCTFDEEFSNSALDATKWVPITTAATNFTTGVECFVNSKNNIYINDGALNLTARKEAAPFTCKKVTTSFTSQYTTGEVSTFGKFSQAFGRIEIRAKFPNVKIPGLHAALWMTPQDAKYGAWPWSGEIDIAESYSSYYGKPVPTIHYVPSTYKDPNWSNGTCAISHPERFHTYTLTWTTTTINIAFDGKTCLNDSWTPMAPLKKPQPFDQPFVITLTQGFGIGSNVFDPGKTPLPATTQIDYVRAWK